QNSILAACVMLLVAACRDSDDPETPPQVPPPVTNRPPVANAGADLSGLVGASLGLSASSSSDPDGDTLSYSWVILSGPVGATITNASGTAATFQAAAA